MNDTPEEEEKDLKCVNCGRTVIDSIAWYYCPFCNTGIMKDL